MNYTERKKLKRTTDSRDKWKARALENGADSRARMFQNRDLTKSREAWRNKAEVATAASKEKDETIRELSTEIAELKLSLAFLEEKSKALSLEKKLNQVPTFK